MIEYYRDAYSIALEKVEERVDEFIETERVEQLPEVTFLPGQIPFWKKVIIQQNIPEKLKPLEEMSKNLWWSWNPEAVEMFRSIDSGTLGGKCRESDPSSREAGLSKII